MKSLQICLLSALLVIAAYANPLPADEPLVAPTGTPVVDVTPVVKSGEQPVVPAVAVTEVPSTQKSLPIDNERIPEPQALPSKKEDAPIKAEEKKREVEQPTVQPVEPQPEQVTGKSLPEQPVVIAAESAVKSVEQPAIPEAVPTVPAVPVAVPETKAADALQAVESTVVPVVPSAIASEKKIDAEAPVAIVSENVEQVKTVEPEQKSALPVPAEQVQVAPQQQPQEIVPVPDQVQALAQQQERSAAQIAEPSVPVVAASSVEPTPASPVVSAEASSGSSEKKIEEDSSSSSSEESKESQEEPEKKQA